MNMKKLWIIAVGLVLVLAAIGLASCAQGPALGGSPSDLRVNLNSQQEGIWVNGQGKVSVVPDIATLGLGIEAQAVSVAEAQSQAASAMDKVMTALKDNGIAAKDIQTQQFSIQKVTRWDKDLEREIVIGYRVTNIVTAKIRDLSKVGATIDAVAAVGGDLTRIDSISFSVENPAPYQEQAREKAMADAKAKSTQMATLAEVKLGKPTYITESVQYPVPIYRQALDTAVPAPAVQTPISPGELEITVNVQVTYSILE